MFKQYVCIDLKSFYASVECVDRGLDPLTTNLVVADSSRTEKTICLAVTPTLKAYGLSGRSRLFEVVQKQKEYGFEYIIAPPKMRRYMEVSNKIVAIYLRYISPDDIHIYSIDEVFMDVTTYLKNYHMTAHELAMTMVKEVLYETGITATAGIGTNMFLAKVAMDVVAKKMPADKDGVRVAELDEISYREQLWDHEPITDIWRVGRGYRKRLAEYGIHTMGDVARCSVTDEDLLYRLFGVNAELLIDHAWGYEPTEIRHIREYRPETNSLGSGQVLPEPYTFDKGKLITREMTELLVLDLVKKRVVTDQMVLTVGYDIESLTNPDIRQKYHGEITTDHYGRKVPKHAHGTANLDHYMSSTRQIMSAMMELYERIVNPDLLIRRITITANHVIYEGDVAEEKSEPRQMTLLDESLAVFSTTAAMKAGNNVGRDLAGRDSLEQRREAERKERRLQHAILDIQEKYGKNALLKGMNLEEGAKTIERNGQVGGHRG